MHSSAAPLAHFDFVTHFGGGQRSTVLLVQALARFDQVRVIDAYGGCRSYLDALETSSVEVTVLDAMAACQTVGGTGCAARLWRAGRAIPGLARLIWRLRATLNHERPRAVWVNSEKALFCVNRATSEVPVVLYLRGEMARPSWYCRRDWRRLAGVCAISRATLQTLPPECRIIPARTVIPNVVSSQELARRRRLAAPLPDRGDELIIVIAATVIPLKAQHVAIEGLARYRARGGRASLWLVGDVPLGDESGYAARLARLCSEAGITKSVHFLGWRDDVAAVMARADVVALTSETEGMPGVLIEAMALAKPVIATRVGGVPELVRDDWNGVLIETGDANAFAVALQRLEDALLRTTMGLRGQTAVGQEFDPERQAREFASFITEVAARWNETRARPAGGKAETCTRTDARKNDCRRAVSITGP